VFRVQEQRNKKKTGSDVGFGFGSFMPSEFKWHLKNK